MVDWLRVDLLLLSELKLVFAWLFVELSERFLRPVLPIGGATVVEHIEHWRWLAMRFVVLQAAVVFLVLNRGQSILRVGVGIVSDVHDLLPSECKLRLGLVVWSDASLRWDCTLSTSRGRLLETSVSVADTLSKCEFSRRWLLVC